MDTDKMQKQFDHIAQKYDVNRRKFIPCFDDYYTRSISLLKNYREHFSSVVDLGAGTGLLTKELYSLYPEASYVLVDLAKDMLQVARERFAGLDKFSFVEDNYVETIPGNSPDLICSALSIHHLEEPEKRTLYQSVYAKLPEGGCFLNLDQFISESDRINQLYDEWWFSYIDKSGISAEQKMAWQERKKLDKENTITETVDMLESAGFGHVECIYNFMKFGVVLAIK